MASTAIPPSSAAVIHSWLSTGNHVNAWPMPSTATIKPIEPHSRMLPYRPDCPARWLNVRLSTSGKAALQKKPMIAMPTKMPSKLVVWKNRAKPASEANADSRTMGMRAPRRSANQPHRLGATTRITCMSDIRMAISVAEKLSDCRYSVKYGEKAPMNAK